MNCGLCVYHKASVQRWQLPRFMECLQGPNTVVRYRQLIIVKSHTLTPPQSSSSHSTPPPSHSSSVGDLGLTGSAIKEEKKTAVRTGLVTNVHGMIHDVIRDASAEIGTGGPQVLYTLCRG